MWHGWQPDAPWAARKCPRSTRSGCRTCLRWPESSLNGESEHLTQLRAAVGRTWPVSVRSLRLCRIYGRLSALCIRMTITYSPNPRCKVYLPQITSDKQNTVGVTKAMITTQTLATSTVATTGKAPRHCHARVRTRRCETYLNRGFGHDITRHETRSERRGATNERETGGRRSSGRACAHARVVIVNSRGLVRL